MPKLVEGKLAGSASAYEEAASGHTSLRDCAVILEAHCEGRCWKENADGDQAVPVSPDTEESFAVCNAKPSSDASSRL